MPAFAYFKTEVVITGEESSSSISSISRVNDFTAGSDALRFTAWTVKLNAPPSAGVPVMRPSDLRVKPSGNAPSIIDQVNESLMSVSRVKLYPLPCCPYGRLSVVMIGTKLFTVIENALVSLPLLFVAVISNS